MNKKIKTLVISFLVIISLSGIDQLIKYFVERDLKPVGSVTVLKGILAFTYVQNNGAMMGLFNGGVIPLTVISFVILAGLIVYICMGKAKINVSYVCVIAMISGGIGNIIDRIARGYVVDYIEALFVDFYVFNFADMLVTCSCFIIVGYEIYQIIAEQKKKKGESNG